MLNLRLSVFEVFNLNFNILKVLGQLSLKMSMKYGNTLFECIPKYLFIRISRNCKIKVYALEDSLGVCTL